MTSLVKTLWASVQGDPVFMRRVNGSLTILWLLMIPVSIVTHWISSVTYVAALSLWALVSGHWSAWQAARVEVNQEREAKERDDADMPGEVVQRMLQETTWRLRVPHLRTDARMNAAHHRASPCCLFPERR